MKRFLEIISALVGSVCALIFLAFLSAGLWTKIYGKTWLENQLKQQFDLTVSIGSLESNFFNSLKAKNVSLSSPVNLQLTSAKLSFQPWELLNPKLAYRNVLFLEIIGLDLNLGDITELTLPSGPPKFQLPKIPVTVLLSSSSVSLAYKGDEYIAEGFSGEVKTTHEKLQTVFRSENGTVGPAKGRLSYEVAGHRIRSAVAFEKIDLLLANRFLSAELKEKLGKVEGDAALKILYNDTTHWEANVDSSNIHWQPAGKTVSYPLTANLDLSPDEISIRKASLNGHVFIQGMVSKWNHAPELNLKIESKEAPIEEIVSLLPNSEPSSMRMGTLTMVGAITGSLAAPIFKADVSAHPQVGNILLPPLEGTLVYENNEITADSTFADGTLVVKGEWEGQNKTSVNLDFTGISLEKIAELNEWKSVHGKIGSRLRMSFGSSKNLQVKGPFVLDKFSWGRIKPREKIQGVFDLDSRHLLLSVAEEDILVNVSVLNDKIEIEQAKINFAENSTLSAHGNIVKKSGQVNCSISGRNIPADLWPPLVERYPEIKGGIDLEGTVYGAKKSLKADLDLVFHDFKFQPSGEAWNGSGAIAYSPSQFILKNIHVDGGYSGELSVKSESDGTAVGFKVLMEQARPELFRDISSSSITVTGSLTGLVDASVKNGFIVGHSSLTWLNGSVSGLPFDVISAIVVMDKSKMNLSDLSLSWDNQTLRGYGVLTKQERNLWNYEANLQAQQVGPPSLKVDGEVQADGSFSLDQKSFKGQLHSAALWLNGNALGDFKMTFEKVGQWFSVNGQAAPLLSFDGRMSTQSGKFKASLIGKDLKLDEIISSYFSTLGMKEIPSGTANVDLRASGTVKAPQIKASIGIPKAKWRNETLSAETYLEVNNSTLTVKSSEIKLEKGGTLYASGTIGLTGARVFDIDGAGSDLALDSLLHLINMPVDWKGKTNAKFTIKGEQVDKRIQFVFEGEHEGFRPFTGKGDVSGTAGWDKGEWNLEGITVGAGDGYVKLMKGSRVFVNKDGSGLMRLIADTRNLRAGPLAFFGGLEASGSWLGTSKLPVGEEKAPLELDIFARSLWVNQILLNGNVTHLTVNRQQLEFSPVVTSDQKVSGVLNYRDIRALELVDFRFMDKGVERFYIDGKIGHDIWDFSLRTKGVEASLVRGLFDTTLSMSGPMDIALRGQGSLENPRLMGTINWKDGQIAGVPVDAASTDMVLENGVVYLKNLKAVRDNGFELKGVMSFGTNFQDKEKPDPPQFDLTIEEGDLAFLKDMWEDVRKAKGSFEGRLKLKDHVEGFLTIKDANIETDSYIPTLKNGTLTLDLKNNKLTISEGRARMNRGELKLLGTIEFEGSAPSQYNLTLNTISEEGVSIRIPELTIPPGSVFEKFSLLKKKLGGVSRGDPIVNLTLTGPGVSPLLAGTVFLENTIFTYPPPANKKKVPLTPFGRWRQSFVNKMNWDVLINADKRTRYENELVSAVVTGHVRISGPTNNMSVAGRVESNSGSLIYTGSEFKLNEALLEIITSTPTFQQENKESFVYLKARAERDVYYSDSLGNGNQDTIIMEVDRSLLGEIKPRFYSKTNPNISPEKALKLALGLDTTDSSNQAVNLAGNQSKTDVDRALRVGLVQLLDSNLATPMARAIARQTGLVDYIRVTYQQDDSIQEGISSADTQSPGDAKVTQNEVLRYVRGTKVKLGREISTRLFADYSFKVDEFQNQVDLQHEVELAYRVHKNLFIRATSELDTERTLGRQPDRRAILENQWRFGLPFKKKAAVPDAKPSPSGSAPLPPIKG